MYLTVPGNRFAPLPNSCLGVVSTLREKEPLPPLERAICSSCLIRSRLFI